MVQSFFLLLKQSIDKYLQYHYKLSIGFWGQEGKQLEVVCVGGGGCWLGWRTKLSPFLFWSLQSHIKKIHAEFFLKSKFPCNFSMWHLFESRENTEFSALVSPSWCFQFIHGLDHNNTHGLGSWNTLNPKTRSRKHRCRVFILPYTMAWFLRYAEIMSG